MRYGLQSASIDVYVAPMRPYTCPDQLGEGEVATWAPSSSTLVSGATEGILIDALLTFENADRIAAWAKGFGKKITGVYIAHGHSDHWLGLARLLQHFPEVRGYAAPEVVRRAAWEAEFNKTTKYWTSRFPGELPDTPVVPEVLNIDEILVDSQVVSLIHVATGMNRSDRAASRYGLTIRPLAPADRGSMDELPDRVSPRSASHCAYCSQTSFLTRGHDQVLTYARGLPFPTLEASRSLKCSLRRLPIRLRPRKSTTRRQEK
jgi:metallo-beta-lactamase superfamily protein